jgi:hypothetical protein
MAFPEIAANHFDGHKNLTQAQKEGDGPTAAELFGKFKAGTVTAAGAGDEVIAFTTAFADANYAVVLGPGSVSGGTVKDGTKAAGGFTIVAGGAGIIDWFAVYLG